LRTQRSQRDDHHGRRRLMAAHRHDNVEELFRAQIGGKASLVDNEIGEVQPHTLRQHAAGAVGDVGERSTVHDRWGALRRLHEIRQQRVVE
jgi:hypothetical protein